MGYWSNDSTGGEYVPSTSVPLQGGGGGGKAYNKIDFAVSFDSGLSAKKDFEESDDMKRFLNDIRK